jgi:hypothetical protein
MHRAAIVAVLTACTACSSAERSPAERSFAVTITNERAEPIFVSGTWLPFGISREGDPLQLGPGCPCDRCGSGEGCMFGDPPPSAVEIPGGGTLEVEAELRWHTARDVTESSCPEVFPSSTCSVPHAFETGAYEIVVPFDDRAAMEAQELEPTSTDQWGLPWWSAAGIGTVELGHEQRTGFAIEAEGPVHVDVVVP